MAGIRRRCALAAAANGVVLGSTALGAINASWVAPVSDSWTSPTAWSTNPVYPNIDQPNPGDLYNALIGAAGSSYTVTLDSDITISSLQISSTNATLQQTAGTLRLVDGGLNVTAGTYRMDDGTLASDDPMNISASFLWNGGTISGFGAVNLGPSSVTSLGNFPHTLATTLNNAGVVSLSNSPILLDNGTINNLAGATMNLVSGKPFNTGSGSNLVNNAGTMNLPGPFNTVTISVPFQDSGTINVNGGTLQFNSSGSFVTWLAGATLAGPGTADFGSAINHVLAGNLTLNVSNAQLNSASISGSGDLLINDDFFWNAGTMSGSGTTRVAHGAAIDFSKASGPRGLSRTLNNSGVMNLANGQLQLNNGTLNNLSDGVINVTGSQPFQAFVGTPGGLINNAGIINVNAASFGTATLTSMTDSGTINAVSGTTAFSGTFNFQTGATLTGSGTIDLGTFNNLVVGGTLTLAGSNMRIGGGSITGSGNVILTNTLNWNGGTFDGAGSFGGQGGAGLFNVMPGAVLNVGIGGSRSLSRVLNNSGVINMLSGTNIPFVTGAALNNLAGGTLNIYTLAPFVNNTGSVSVVHNNGVINVDPGGAVSSGSIVLGSTTPVVNSGTINLLSGSLALGSGTQTAGAYISGAGYIDLNGVSFGTQVLDGTTTLVGSNLNLSAGTVSGEGNLLIRGNFNWSGGTFLGSGNIDVGPGSIFSVPNQNSHSLGRNLNNSGVINLSQGSITLNNATLNNLPGATINLSGNTSFGVFSVGFGSLSSALINSGQINLAAGTSSLVLFSGGSSSLVNSGTINVPTGTLLLGGGTHSAGAAITGGGFVDLTGSNSFGTVTVNDTLTVLGSNVNFNGGFLQGPGDISVINVFNWGSGSMTGAGAVNVAPGAAMNIISSFDKVLGRAINNAGTLNLNYTTGTMRLSGGAINNLAGGVMNLNTPSSAFSNTGSVGILSNDGTINFAASVSLSPLLVTDSGTMNVATGNLAMGTTTLESGAFFGGNGSVSFNSSGSLTVNGTATLAINAQMAQGLVQGPGDLNVGKSFSFGGGTISGSGVVNILPAATFSTGTTANLRTLSRTINNSGVMKLPTASLKFAGGTINNTAAGIVIAGSLDSFVSLEPIDGGINRFVNAGTFNVTAGTVELGIPFTNTGTVEVGNPSPAAASFTGGVSQIVGSTLVRGHWIVHPDSSLTLGTATITNNAANVTLDGVNSLFPTIDPIANNSGTFQIVGGRTFVTSASYTNSGDTVVGAGSTLHISGALSSTGTLDIQGTLIVDGASPTAILSAILAGRNGGAWNGAGISSSAAAADPNTALGFAAVNAMGAAPLGSDPSSSSVVVRYTLLGDANLDNVVNALDFNALATHYGQSNSIWSDSDFNYDGSVDTSDFINLAMHFGGVLSARPAPGESLGAVVPEPTACALLGASLLLLRRRVRGTRLD